MTATKIVNAPDARNSPVSKDKTFKPILTRYDEETTRHLARFIEVLQIDDSGGTA